MSRAMQSVQRTPPTPERVAAVLLEAKGILAGIDSRRAALILANLDPPIRAAAVDPGSGSRSKGETPDPTSIEAQRRERADASNELREVSRAAHRLLSAANDIRDQLEGIGRPPKKGPACWVCLKTRGGRNATLNTEGLCSACREAIAVARKRWAGPGPFDDEAWRRQRNTEARKELAEATKARQLREIRKAGA